MRFPPFRGTRPTALALLSAVVLGLSCDAQRADERVATTAGAFSIVPTQGGGNYRQQAVVDDALTYAAVSSPQFRHLVTLPVEGNIYAQPLATTIVRSGHTVPVVLVATTENLLYAFEGERPYQELWPRISFGRPADFLGSLPYAQNYNNDVCRSNVGRVGILSTPVISGGFVYLIAETEESSTNLAHTMYKVRMDGTIAASQRISATGANRSVFQSNLQLQRPGLLASNGVIYAAFGSHCDVDLDDFRGWVLAFDDGDLHQLATYCTTCQAAGGRFPYESRGGIWQSGSGLATDRDGNVLFMVGNGKSAPDDPGNTGTSIVSLNTAAVRAGTLDVHTFFTPADEFYETKIDADLGSSGPVYVPDGNLVYGGGKTGTLFLLDAANFGGFHNVTNSQIRGQTQASCNLADHLQPVACTTLDPPIEMEPDAAVYGHIHGTPPYWADHHRLFVWGQGDYPRWKDIDTGARRFSGGTGVNPHRPFGASAGGTGGLLSLSTNSHGEAILWATWRFPGSLDTFGFSERVNQYRGIPTGETGDGLFVALQGDSLLQLSAAFPIRGQAKMTAPLVANGKVYVATQAGGVMVYGIDGDADGDGWPDGPDNCPDVYNADQTDTNLEAELIVAARDGVVCSDGTRPPGAPVGPVEESRTTIVGDLFPSPNGLVEARGRGRRA